MPISNMKMQKPFKFFFTDFISNNNNILYKTLNFIILFIVLFVIIFFRPPAEKLKKIDEKLKKTYITKSEIRYLDTSATKRNEEIIKLTTPPVFIFNKDNIKLLYKRMENIIDKIFLSLSFIEIKESINNNNLSLNEEQYKLIKELFAENENFLDIFLSIYNKIIYTKIIDSETNINSFDIPGVKIGEYENEKYNYTVYLFEELDTLFSIKPKIKKEIKVQFQNLDNHQLNILTNFIHQNTFDNIKFDKKSTDFELEKRLVTESKVYRTIPPGTRFTKNTIVNKNNIDQINTIIKAYKNHYSLSNIISTIMIILLITTLIYFIIHKFQMEVFKDFKNFIFISIMIIGSVLYFIIPVYTNTDYTQTYYGFYILISAISLTLLFLYNRTFSILFTILMSILFFYITDFLNYPSFIFVFFSGIFTVLVISRLNKRLDILIIGLLIALTNLIIAFFIYCIVEDRSDLEITKFFILPILNGILSSVLAFLIIILGESFLNTPTVFILQELSHFTSPLLKKLFNSAIGTYNHSVIVGNLAESAAQEIGANALLAKVGGYYHDIGKLDNPEYFIENQNDFNKHDSLKPSMSTAIIKAHVKIGVEKAKKAKLPQKVIDIIEQHHGNSLIRYFYQEALKNNPGDKEEIQKLNYHYQNINPEFPEAAIVLLADQVEAATRTIKKYTITNIEKTIEKIVDDNFQEGILDNSGLTLKNITRIKKTFSKIIAGMYHPRIEYPTSHLSEENKKSNNNSNKQVKNKSNDK